MSKLAVRAVNKGDFDESTSDKEYIYLATKQGLIQGKGPRVVAADGETTRAESVTVIERILTRKAGCTLEVDKYAQSQAEIEWYKTNIITMLPRYFSKGRSDLRVDQFEWTGDNGNVFHEVQKYVIVDMNDPDDPNRGLVPDDIIFRGTGFKWESVKNFV